MAELDRLEQVKIRKENALLIRSLVKSGDPGKFLKAWTNLIPQEIQMRSEYKNLTAYLYVYFSTLECRRHAGNSTVHNRTELTPIEEGGSEKTSDSWDRCERWEACAEADRASPCGKQSDFSSPNYIVSMCSRRGTDEEQSPMDLLKTYLEQNAAELSTQPDIIPYFALPFISQPNNHPAFNQIFRDEWLKKLEDNLNSFLMEFSSNNATSLSPANKICDSTGSSAHHNCLYFTKYKEIKQKFNRLRRDHQSVVGVASELAAALENSVKGEAVDLKETLENCINIFPDLFSKSNFTFNYSMDDDSLSPPSEREVSCSHIDWQKVRKDLIESNVKTKLLLLQALRRCLTRRDYVGRNEAAGWMRCSDVLGGGALASCLVPRTLPHPLQQAASRLTNALASLSQGCLYLHNYLKLLTTGAVSASDPITLNMMVATLQKLSIKKVTSRELVDLNVIDWLLEQLQKDTVTVYFLEYGVSLLMNLCLGVQPEYWDSVPTPITSALVHLIKTYDKEHLLENLLGCGYWLVKSEVLNGEFAKLDLETVLKRKMTPLKQTETLAKQYDTLLQLHKRVISPHSVTAWHDESNQTQRDMDPEIEEDDLVRGNPSGEDLLRLNYSLASPQSCCGDKKRHIADLGGSRVRLQPTVPRSSSSCLAWSQDEDCCHLSVASIRLHESNANI